VKELGGCHGFTPEQLSAQINRLKQRLQKETNRYVSFSLSLSIWMLPVSKLLSLILLDRYTESIDDLRAMQIKKENKVLKKQQMYGAFREKLNVSL
jgi:hypothetical protein